MARSAHGAQRDTPNFSSGPSSARVTSALAAHHWLALLLALAAWLSSTHALAGILVDVRKVYASGEREFVDPKLDDLKTHFSRFAMFSSFEDAGLHSLTFEKEGDERTLAMPGAKELKLIFRGSSKGYIKLRFELGDLKMNVRIHEGGLFFHSGVPHEKGRMVLAIRARPDGKDDGRAAGPTIEKGD